MGDGSSAARFSFTKLVVGDLDRAGAFYRGVCGYGEGQLASATIAGRPIEELMLRRPDGTLDLVLLTYPGEAPPSSSGVITVFDTPDLPAFEARLIDAGGTVVEPMTTVEFGPNRMRIAIYADPQGFMLEVRER